MDQDRRNDGKQDRVDAGEVLNEAQLHTLHTIEQFGWKLRFIREPLFLEAVPVVYSPGGKAFAVIEEDGRLNTDIDIRLREERRLT